MTVVLLSYILQEKVDDAVNGAWKVLIAGCREESFVDEVFGQQWHMFWNLVMCV